MSRVDFRYGMAWIRPTAWMKVKHTFKGCWPAPRPPSGTHVWAARHCPVCYKYPVGRWRMR